MKNKGIPALSAALLMLTIASCDGTYDSNGAFKRVDYAMRGTWQCLEKTFWQENYSTLVLTYNTITITGPITHLQDFTRKVTLEAYTEDVEDSTIKKLLYIKDRGVWQKPITYIYWKSADSKDTLITFSEGSAPEETLKKIQH
ncbi:MAG: hypothetical protein LBO67_03895 [Spirochaetaceae bacterium]|jgi:hypothetical protein|nr:hypothetical protein [Spirochaetaceae bacterium]